jgi:hypothetical protein
VESAALTPRNLAKVTFAVVAVNNFGDTRSGGLAGPMGLFIIVLMSIAVVLLIRNMNKRLRRLPDSFPDQEATQREAEIAQLDADLSRPDGGPDRPGVDADQSGAPAEATETEVNGVDSDHPRLPGTTEDGRA